MAKMPSNPGAYGVDCRVTLAEFTIVILVTLLVTLIGPVTLTLDGVADCVETALADNTMNWPVIRVG